MEDYRTWSPSRLSGDATYHLLTSLVVPRPIGWISTVDADGRPNLAPYSFFNLISSVPPVVYYSAGGKSVDGEPTEAQKDSIANAEATGEFVVNIVSEDLLGAMVTTATSLAPGESEFVHAGLQEAASRVVRPPRVARARAALECRLHTVSTIGLSRIVLGEVVSISVREDCIVDGRIDPTRLLPVGRLGGSVYTMLREVREQRRT